MSIQTSYSYSLAYGLSGSPADNGQDMYFAPGKNAAETIIPGKALVWANSTQTTVRHPLRNRLTITFSAALSASNAFTMTITTTDLAGTVTTVAMSETYATSAAATYAAIIADAAAADADISGAAVGDVITLTVAGNKYLTVTVAGAVAGGSAVTVTSAYTSADTVIGLAGYEVLVPTGFGVTPVFAVGDPVPVMRKGRMWVVSDETAATTDTVYFRFIAGTSANEERGTLRVSAGTGALGMTATGFSIIQGASADAVAKVECNLP